MLLLSSEMISYNELTMDLPQRLLIYWQNKNSVVFVLVLEDSNKEELTYIVSTLLKRCTWEKQLFWYKDSRPEKKSCQTLLTFLDSGVTKLKLYLLYVLMYDWYESWQSTKLCSWCLCLQYGC